MSVNSLQRISSRMLFRVKVITGRSVEDTHLAN